MKTTTLKIGNFGSKFRAYEKAVTLGAMTLTSYHCFTYTVVPAGGSFDLMLNSTYPYESDDPEKEMLHIFTSILVRDL